MKTGLSEDNLPLSLTRKLCRLFTAYYIAYNEGKDIIQADAWIRKHRSHRGHSVLMDNRPEQSYYPYGREEEVIDIDNDDHIITANDIEYINDGTVDDDLDVWMEMLEDYHENGGILNLTTLLFHPEYFERVQDPNLPTLLVFVCGNLM
jgi:hypothetical protein